MKKWVFCFKYCGSFKKNTSNIGKGLNLALFFNLALCSELFNLILQAAWNIGNTGLNLLKVLSSLKSEIF